MEHTLLVFADYACPYCYLAESALGRLRDETPVAVDLAAFELRPAGTVLPSVTEAWMREAWRRTVEPLAEELGVTMEYPRLTTRTRKAHEAVAYARDHGAGTALHEAVYRAYWRDGRDIGRIDVLMELGREAGLDPAGVKVALDIDQWTARVERDQALAAQLGLRGVPAYVLGGGQEVRVGLQHYDELRDWVMKSHDV
jgi:predicted DsbA family dithiol-disulfide isomerase